MHVVVQHRITDPEKFFSMDAEEVGGGGPPGVQVRQFFPFKDRSAAVCLWEADSIDTLRGYLDPATAGVQRERVLRGRQRARRWAFRRLLLQAPNTAPIVASGAPSLGALRFLASGGLARERG